MLKYMINNKVYICSFIEFSNYWLITGRCYVPFHYDILVIHVYIYGMELSLVCFYIYEALSNKVETKSYFGTKSLFFFFLMKRK